MHHVDHGILPGRVIGNEQIAGRVIDRQADDKASRRSVEGGIRGLDAFRRDFADLISQDHADEEVVVLVEDEVLAEFVLGRIKGYKRGYSASVRCGRREQDHSGG